MVLIENEGALFRGPARTIPQEVWANGKWQPYKLAGQPKPIDWGTVISDEEAKALMGDDAGADGAPEKNAATAEE